MTSVVCLHKGCNRFGVACGNWLIYVTRIKCLEKRQKCFWCLLFSLCLSLSFVLSQCDAATAISLVIDHSFGWAPTTLPSLETWLCSDSINFHVNERVSFQGDTEHLCRSLHSKSTELCLPVPDPDAGSRCQVMMSFTQTVIHSLKMFRFRFSMRLGFKS